MKREKTPYREAAVRLKARREACGLSVPALAERLGVSTARYRHWEKLFGPLPQRQYGEAIDRIFGEGGQPPSSAGDEPSLEHPNHEALGARARARREQLALSRGFVAAKLGIIPLKLLTWERSLPRRHRGELEDAWEDALSVPRGWLRAPWAELPAHKPPAMSDLGCLTVEDEIRAVATWLTRASALRRVWRFDDLSEAEKRRATIFAERYGASCHRDSTLQAIGDRFSLTRERVRQIVDVMTDRARGAPFDLPRLAQIRDAARGHQLWRVDDFDQAHHGVLGGVSLPDADRFAREILGFGIASFSERVFVQNANPISSMMIIDEGFHELVVAVRSSAMKMNRSCGAAHVMYVTGLASEILGKPVAHSDVLRALPAIEGLEWLTEDADWFWLGPDAANNRVLEVVRKVLAVAACRVDVEDLHQAVCRSRRAHYRSETRAQPPEIEVPQDILREILCRVPWLTVIQMNDFALADEMALESTLNSSELAVVRVIEEHGGAVWRNVLNKRFVDAGKFTQANLNFVLAVSPVIQQLGFGIYGIRGRPFPQKAFAEAAASGPRRHPSLAVDS